MGKFNNDDRVDLAVIGDAVAIFVNDGSANFGPSDSTPPVIRLRGDATINITIDTPYSDAGATASDAEDGDITSRIVVTNPVNTTVLGSYTITYAVSDRAGNAAVPVTRTVNVQPQPGADDGGGGAVGLGTLAWLLAAMLRRRKHLPCVRPWPNSGRAPVLRCTRLGCWRLCLRCTILLQACDKPTEPTENACRR